MNVTLRQLEVFTAIASHGSVTHAAEAVAMTQAAASMALAELERQLDAQLFDRVGRRLLLNDTGRLLLTQAQEVLDRARDFEALAHGPAFDLHLGASVTIGNHLLPGLLAQIKTQHPAGRVRVSRFNTEQVVEQLLAFRIDLGFIEGPALHQDLRHFAWRRDRLVPFAAPAHPLSGRRLQPSDLADAEWIVREHGSGTREIFERASTACGLAPRIALELEQPEAIRQCVRAGLGIGCLSELELEEAFAAGSLVPLDVPALAMPREMHIVMHRHKHAGKGILAVLDCCGIPMPA